MAQALFHVVHVGSASDFVVNCCWLQFWLVAFANTSIDCCWPVVVDCVEAYSFATAGQRASVVAGLPHLLGIVALLSLRWQH